MKLEGAFHLGRPPSPAPERPQLAVSLGQYSSPGRKPENQDFHGALQPQGEALTGKGIAVALADGISSSRLGAAAAETAVKAFLTDYYCTSEAWSVQVSAERVIVATNSWMHAQNRRSGRALSDEAREQGLICTFSALVLKSRSAHVFHVGDARVARVAGDSLEPLTEPHRVSLGSGESYLGRALGMNRTVEIDYRKLPLEEGDVFVLTTDGVHEFVPDTVVARLASGGDLDHAARAIAEAALAAGSEDNLTVQLVRVESLPAGEVDDLLGTDLLLPPAPRLVPGTQFEGYQVLRELHSGSRSHVYLARDPADQRLVAIKVASTEHAADPIQLRALLLEEWIARRVNHPHVAKGKAPRRNRRHAYAVSEYVPGQTLAQWMADHPQPDLVTVRSLAKQIASAVQAFHRRAMLHRDLRPANIMVDADGTAKLIDFGSAQVAGIDDLAERKVEDSAFAGTLQYSAPEIYLGQRASRRSDIYSLGVIVYQLLTGTLPYGPRVATATTRKAQKSLRYTAAMQHNPAVPEWMDAAVARAVAVDPAARYGELSEFLYDLHHPNPELVHLPATPLLLRRPETLWQGMCLLLAGIIVALVAT
jgi:serine/threonine protein phosphatase PrpC